MGMEWCWGMELVGLPEDLPEDLPGRLARRFQEITRRLAGFIHYHFRTIVALLLGF